MPEEGTEVQSPPTGQAGTGAPAGGAQLDLNTIVNAITPVLEKQIQGVTEQLEAKLAKDARARRDELGRWGSRLDAMEKQVMAQANTSPQTQTVSQGAEQTNTQQETGNTGSAISPYIADLYADNAVLQFKQDPEVSMIMQLQDGLDGKVRNAIKNAINRGVDGDTARSLAKSILFDATVEWQRQYMAEQNQAAADAGAEGTPEGNAAAPQEGGGEAPVGATASEGEGGGESAEGAEGAGGVPADASGTGGQSTPTAKPIADQRNLMAKELLDTIGGGDGKALQHGRPAMPQGDPLRSL